MNPARRQFLASASAFVCAALSRPVALGKGVLAAPSPAVNRELRESAYRQDEMVQRARIREAIRGSTGGQDETQDRLLAQDFLRLRHRQRTLLLPAGGR